MNGCVRYSQVAGILFLVGGQNSTDGNSGKHTERKRKVGRTDGDAFPGVLLFIYLFFSKSLAFTAHILA